MVTPALEFPFYFSALRKTLAIHEQFGLLSHAAGFLRWIRPYLLFMIRLVVSLIAHVLMKVRYCSTQDEKVDILFVARSLGHADLFMHLMKGLNARGKTCRLMIDLTLFQATQRLPAWLLQSRTHLLLGSNFINLSTFAKLAWRCVFRGEKLKGSGQSITLSNGDLEVREQLRPLLREYELTSVDLEIHCEKVRNAIRRSQTKTLVTGELVSPYIFAHAKVAHELGVRNLRIQTAGLHADDVVDIGDCDAFILTEQKTAEEMRTAFPDARDRILFLGHPLFDPLGEKERKTNQRADSFQIVFFSQPLERELNLQLVRSLHEEAKAWTRTAKVSVKPHPRDRTDYSEIDGVDTLPRNLSTLACLDSTDLAVSRCSSVLADALAIGTPYIACRLTAGDRDYQPPYLSPELEVSVFSLEELRQQMRSIEKYMARHAVRREEYLQKNLTPFNWTEFLSKSAH